MRLIYSSHSNKYRQFEIVASLDADHQKPKLGSSSFGRQFLRMEQSQFPHLFPWSFDFNLMSFRQVSKVRNETNYISSNQMSSQYLLNSYFNGQKTIVHQLHSQHYVARPFRTRGDYGCLFQCPTNSFYLSPANALVDLKTRLNYSLSCQRPSQFFWHLSGQSREY